MAESVPPPSVEPQEEIPELERNVAPLERQPMNPSSYETLFGMMNDSLVSKINEKHHFTLQLGGQGSSRDDTITFERTDLGGGTQQETIHIPDAWMSAVGATSAEEFIQKLQEA